MGDQIKDRGTCSKCSSNNQLLLEILTDQGREACCITCAADVFQLPDPHRRRGVDEVTFEIGRRQELLISAAALIGASRNRARMERRSITISRIKGPGQSFVALPSDQVAAIAQQGMMRLEYVWEVHPPTLPSRKDAEDSA